MEGSKRECDTKMQCYFCQKKLVKRYMDKHIEAIHSEEENFEAKSHIITCLTKFDEFFLNYLLVKEKVPEINNLMNPSIVDDPIFIDYQNHMKLLVRMNLAKAHNENDA